MSVNEFEIWIFLLEKLNSVEYVIIKGFFFFLLTHFGFIKLLR